MWRPDGVRYSASAESSDRWTSGSARPGKPGRSKVQVLIKMGIIYLIQSETTKDYYFGSTSNLDRRLKEHNSRKSRSTRNKIPWRLIQKEEFPDIKMARSIEQKMKKWKTKISPEKFKKIIENYRG